MNKLPPIINLPKRRKLNEIIPVQMLAGALLVTLGIGIGYFLGRLPTKQIPAKKDNTATQFETVENNNPGQVAGIDTSAPVENFEMNPKAADNYGNAKISLASENSNELPEISSFSEFEYVSSIGKTLRISGTCKDSYYAVLVFEKEVDYKTAPNKAKINNAEPCDNSQQFSILFNLKKYNLTDGNYYFFVADQAKTGSWYNPR